jgi:hypothetical protein
MAKKTLADDPNANEIIPCGSHLDELEGRSTYAFFSLLVFRVFLPRGGDVGRSMADNGITASMEAWGRTHLMALVQGQVWDNNNTRCGKTDYNVVRCIPCSIYISIIMTPLVSHNVRITPLITIILFHITFV